MDLEVLAATINAGGFLAHRDRRGYVAAHRIVYTLLDAGREDLVPEWFRGDNRPPRPGPVPPRPATPRAVAAASQAAPPPAAAEAPLEPLQVPIATAPDEILLPRLRREVQYEKARIVATLAYRHSEQCRDEHSIGNYIKQLWRVANGDLSWEGYSKAVKAGRTAAKARLEKPGAAFTNGIKRADKAAAAGKR